MNSIDKQTALLEADQLASDEAAAVEFIITCGFADARLRAAEHIHTKASLEKVLQAMRKVDRRVAKLMQARLDAIIKGELIAKHAQECLASATRLLQDNPLIPNRVAEIDRLWRSIGEVEEPYRSQFDTLRAEMEKRLGAQTMQQRALIDALESLKGIQRNVLSMPFDQLSASKEKLAQTWSSIQRAPEFVSLPKQLVAEFENEYKSFVEYCDVMKRRSEGMDAKLSMLNYWESQADKTLNPDELRREWEKLPASGEAASEQALQQRFEALTSRLVSAVEETSSSASREKLSDADMQTFLDLLNSLEQATQEGRLLEAAQLDDSLSHLEKQAQRLPQSLNGRIANARAALKRLQGWARWSGNVSREALIKSVEDLSAQDMPLKELAKAISAARESWKALDAQSGAAPKALWHRFDAVCTAAYTPIAEHSRKQAETRRQNKERAEALLADVRNFIDKSGLKQQASEASAVNWKRVAVFYQGIVQSWQRIGHMDRKERKRLDAEFAELNQQMREPLAVRWAEEVEKRERLIREVEQITSDDRRSIDKLRSIQQRWQECAKKMPIEHKMEQALWGRFRKACDAVFAERKTALAAADAERKKHAEAKLALCKSLEAARNESEETIKTLLRETDAAWKGAGHVPRAQEQQIEGRYRKAVSALQERLKKAAQQAKQAQRQTLVEKMAVCRELEAALKTGSADAAVWQARWQALPELNGPREAILKKRFEAAMAALSAGDQVGYVGQLEDNRQMLEKELLRAEILAGIDSPPELAQDRLQVQVEILQSSMSGNTSSTLHETLMMLCALPALTDQATAARIERLLNVSA